VVELLVDEIGSSLKWATVKIEKRTGTSAPAGPSEEGAPPF
jgi:hypothetical protein